MCAMASQITGASIVCSNVCSGAVQRKHQSSASLAFVRGIHRWPVNSPHKGPVMRKLFPFDDVIMMDWNVFGSGTARCYIWFDKMIIKKIASKGKSVCRGSDKMIHDILLSFYQNLLNKNPIMSIVSVFLREFHPDCASFHYLLPLVQLSNIGLEWFIVKYYNNIWVRSRRCDCLVTWFCYHLIAKTGNKTVAPSWPDPYALTFIVHAEFGCVTYVLF